MKLKLLSPVGSKPVTFTWPDNLPSHEHRKSQRNIALEIIFTIKWICEDFPELKLPLNNNILVDYDITSYESMRSLCERYNKLIKLVVTLNKGTTIPTQRLNEYPSKEFLRHIMQQTYNYAVSNPQKLNQYEPFSSQAYGEASFDFIWDMICHLDVTENDIFLDLGSGIGQVVLQMAAQTSCGKCFGIEIGEIPHYYAEQMDKYFRSYMAWYGKKYSKYKLIQGDFLDAAFREIINESTIIFVNNFMFGPAIDNKLTEIFADLKDLTKIVSIKSLCRVPFRLSRRNVHDIGAILRVSKLNSSTQSVSWTSRPISYYLHVIDRSILQNYMDNLTLGDEDERFSYVTTNSDDTYMPYSDSSTVNCWSSSESVASSIVNQRKKPLIRPKLQKNKPPKKKFKKNLAEESRVALSEQPFYANEYPSNTNMNYYPEILTSLNNLMDNFKVQYIQMLRMLSNPNYKYNVENQIRIELAKKRKIKENIIQLERENGKLKTEGVDLLKSRMGEIGIVAESAEDFFNQANKMTLRHKTLQANAKHLQNQVNCLVQEQNSILERRLQAISG